MEFLVPAWERMGWQYTVELRHEVSRVLQSLYATQHGIHGRTGLFKCMREAAMITVLNDDGTQQLNFKFPQVFMDPAPTKFFPGTPFEALPRAPARGGFRPKRGQREEGTTFQRDGSRERRVDRRG